MRYIKKFLSLLLHLIKYLLILAVAIIILLAIFLSNVYSDFKNVAGSSVSGKYNLELAVSAAKTEDWGLALEHAEVAREDFNDALDSIKSSRKNPLIKNENFLRTQVNDVEYLVKTAEVLARSLENSLPIVMEVDEILGDDRSFSSLSEGEKSKFIKVVYESEPELNGLKANLDLALLNLNKIHRIGVLLPIYNQISEFKEQLIEATALIEKVSPLSGLLPVLSGYPETSRFLIILQNNDELRPSGGFIGLYGLLEIRNGEIIHLKTHDSYHLDMPSVGKWKKEPPTPIKRYMGVENWYLRDANWYPDWPSSARNILDIYKGENEAIGKSASEFTAVIAINPDFIADLIGMVGDISAQGDSYNPDNFQELLQYNVEVAYKEQDIASWDRKNVVNDLIVELKKRFFTLPTKDWPQVFDIINENILAKNIQVYFPKEDQQELLNGLGVGGEMKQTQGDYLMIVDANLAAFKSDAVMEKKASYSLEKGKDLVANLKLNYRHNGGFDWRTTRYRSYTRIYVPLGSELVSINGLNKEKLDFDVSDDKELNKTVFGFFWTIEPGRYKEVFLKYRLPEKIKTALNIGSYYELYWQKQSGNDTYIDVDLNLSRKNNLYWQGELRSDKFFRIDLQSN